MRFARVRARRDGAIRKGETVSEEQQAAEAAPEYAVVELMGHVRHVGRLTEVDRFGSKMGRIDIPKGGKFEDGFTSVFFSGSAIYRVTPCDLATVERANQPSAPVGRLTYVHEAEGGEYYDDDLT